MKLEKLYTLSQFVDLMEQSTVEQMVEIFGKQYHKIIPITIFKYNKFLKKPIKEEMIVNRFGEKPDSSKIYTQGMSFDTDYNVQIKKWQEAEDKLLFKGGKISWAEDYLTVYEIGNIEISYNSIQDKWHTEDEEFVLTSIHDLAEATKSELTINLEI